MRKRRGVQFLAIGLGAALAAAPAQAGETVTYVYDALGRLVGATTTGSVNDGLSVSTSYDPAGNRANYSVGTGGSPPPPPPPPPNQPPVAVNNSGSMNNCTPTSFAVLANDYDPDGNTPLALVSVSGGGTRGTPTISGTSILFTPSGLTGTANVSYTMRDSLGATASASLTITVTNGGC